tara:strand:+ start:500 stop:1054 length:555 start_codon:yes stop_codon:yes gene_type:complete
MTDEEKIFTLVFNDDKKRIINLNTFIGSEMILILLGFKQYDEMKKAKIRKNSANELIYFKDYLSVSSDMWDIYMCTLKQGIMYKGEENMKNLIEFNEIIGGDKRIDMLLEEYNKEMIIKENNPKEPNLDLKEEFIWRPCSISRIREYEDYDEWTCTGIIKTSKHNNNKESLFWMRKKKLKEEKE